MAKKRELGPIVAFERARNRHYFYRLGLNREGYVVFRSVPTRGPKRFALYEGRPETCRDKLVYLGAFLYARPDGSHAASCFDLLRDKGLLKIQPDYIVNAVVAQLMQATP